MGSLSAGSESILKKVRKDWQSNAEGVIELLSDFRHFARVDASDYTICSSLTGLFCHDTSIVHCTMDRLYFTRGDVVVVTIWFTIV